MSGNYLSIDGIPFLNNFSLLFRQFSLFFLKTLLNINDLQGNLVSLKTAITLNNLLLQSKLNLS